MTQLRIRRGVFRCLVYLWAALNRWITGINDGPKPFVWIKAAETFLESSTQ